MSVITNDIRDEVKACLDKIAAKRAAKLTITNDARARAAGMYFDDTGTLRFDAKRRAVCTQASVYWPEMPKAR